MPWYDPVLPVAGTAITVPFYQQNIYEPLRDLHQRVGSGSPGGSGKFLVSTSSTAGGWRLFAPATDIADGDLPASKLPDNGVDGDAKLTNGSVTGTDSNGSIPVEGVALDRLKIDGTDGAAAGFLPITRDIGAGVIRPIWAKLKYDEIDAENAAADGLVVTYDGTSGKFKWNYGVPSGLIASFRTAAAIAAGWNRCDGGGSPARPNMDGRMPVGAGTSFSVTFTENTNIGTSWSHDHAIPHVHQISGDTEDSRGGHRYDHYADPSGSDYYSRSESHDHVFYGVTGVPVATGSAAPPASATAKPNSDPTAWTIPSTVVVWAIKS